VAAVDCTGHGVPGAFMSMIGNAFLNEIINEKGITEPGKVLSEMRDRVKTALKQTGSEGEARDGMDMALISYDEKNNILEFAGANNPLWIINSTESAPVLKEYEPDKRPIGYFMGKSLPFKNTTIPIEKGDTIYMFTDGLADQFGGPKGKKFKYRQMKEIFLSVHGKDLTEQHDLVLSSFHDWKKDLEQVDDVCVIGLRL
jgi:serine phosphatase RsbU (regulator of sigma subunit)